VREEGRLGWAKRRTKKTKEEKMTKKKAVATKKKTKWVKKQKKSWDWTFFVKYSQNVNSGKKSVFSASPRIPFFLRERRK
jgi:hypothetical protein